MDNTANNSGASSNAHASGRAGGSGSNNNFHASGGGGGSTNNFKVSKIMIHPNRKVNLGNYETIDLNAGLEITFDRPISFDDPLLQKALTKCRETIKTEFQTQIEPYKKLLKANKH